MNIFFKTLGKTTKLYFFFFLFSHLPVLAVESIRQPEELQEHVFTQRGKIKIDRYSHDFGKVYRGQKLSTRFSFTNIGTDPLKLHGVHAACGCIVTDIKNTRIYASGENGEFSVAFDTTHFKGKVEKIVSIIFNEAPAQTVNFKLSVDIEEEIFAEPPIVDFGDLPSPQDIFKEVRIHTAKGSRIKLQGLRASSEHILHSYQEVEPGKWLLLIRLAPLTKVGFLKETIWVANSSKHLPELPVFVRANIKGDFERNDAYVEFGAIPKSAQSRRAVVYRILNHHKIVGAQSEIMINGIKMENSDSLVSWTLDQKSPSQTQLNLALNNIAEKSGTVHGRLILQTSNPLQPELSIDFYAYFR